MADIVPLPGLSQVFRVRSLETQSWGIRRVNLAELYGRGSHLRVYWPVSRPNANLVPYGLCAIRWTESFPDCERGAIQVMGVSPVQAPQSGVDLFTTVPTDWGVDPKLLEQASQLWQDLPEPQRALFNAVCWEGDRFQRFCTGPSSMRGHHSERCGNFRHTVEVAEEVAHFCAARQYANHGVAVLAALLHDIGKADEYEWSDKGEVQLSNRGKLVGHRWTSLEWIAGARYRWAIPMPDDEYLSLLHSLTAVHGAPAWMGLRSPATPEAALLSTADRLSASSALLSRNEPAAGGWGQSHPHMRGQHFYTGR